MGKVLHLITTFLLLIVVGIIGGLYYMSSYMDEKVVLNTTFEGESITGLTKEELKSKISQRVDEENTGSITLILNGERETFMWKNLGVTYESNGIVNEIFEEQDGNLIERIEFLLKRKELPKDYTLQPMFRKSTFERTIQNSYDILINQPKDASYYIEDDKVIVSGGINGRVIDIESLSNEVVEAVKLEKDAVIIPIKETRPSITKEDIEKLGIKEVIGEYKTYFNSGEKNRTTNVKLSAKSIDGVVLKPGEVFSYNKTVGPRTHSRGYKEAFIYVDGKVEEGLGGGICQVSSTLYNTVLYSNLGIVERHQHGLPVSYVPVSRDATVAWGYLDFKFKNTTDHHIYIQSKTKGNQLIIRIFGTKEGEEEVVLYSEKIQSVAPPVEEKIDSSLERGQEIVESKGSYGYKSKAWKVIKKDGKVISRKLLSSDYYKPKPKVILKGPEVNNEE